MKNILYINTSYINISKRDYRFFASSHNLSSKLPDLQFQTPEEKTLFNVDPIFEGSPPLFMHHYHHHHHMHHHHNHHHPDQHQPVELLL